MDRAWLWERAPAGRAEPNRPSPAPAGATAQHSRGRRWAGARSHARRRHHAAARSGQPRSPTALAGRMPRSLGLGARLLTQPARPLRAQRGTAKAGPSAPHPLQLRDWGSPGWGLGPAQASLSQGWGAERGRAAEGVTAEGAQRGAGPQPSCRPGSGAELPQSRPGYCTRSSWGRTQPAAPGLLWRCGCCGTAHGSPAPQPGLAQSSSPTPWPRGEPERSLRLSQSCQTPRPSPRTWPRNDGSPAPFAGTYERTRRRNGGSRGRGEPAGKRTQQVAQLLDLQECLCG